MATRIALLRAVNVAGTRKLTMAALREFFDAIGADDVRTLLQSGNVVFDADGGPAAWERTLEREAAARLGLDTQFFVRTAAEWRAVVAANPFPDAARTDPGHLLVLFLKDAPNRTQVQALRGAIVGREQVRTEGRHAYFMYPDGIGRSKLTGPLIERHLGTRGTGRNWNTVLKIAALAGAATPAL